MLLALDTSSQFISLAVHDGQSVLAEHTWRTAHHHTVELAPHTEQLLHRAGVEARQLRGIAVALGPGSYTGLRIGLGFAKGLALAHRLPLVGVSTFDILLQAQAPRPERVLLVVTAGRGRVSAAEYGWQARWVSYGPTRLVDWATLAADIQAPTWVCGELDPAGRQALESRPGLVSLASPAACVRRAAYLAEIGWARLDQTHPAEAAALAPIYGGAAA